MKGNFPVHMTHSRHTSKIQFPLHPNTINFMELGMQSGYSRSAFKQLWTCIMISIKAVGLCPTVMKETPVSEPPLETTTTSPRRPPLAATAQVIKISNL